MLIVNKIRKHRLVSKGKDTINHHYIFEFIWEKCMTPVINLSAYIDYCYSIICFIHGESLKNIQDAFKKMLPKNGSRCIGQSSFTNCSLNFILQCCFIHFDFIYGVGAIEFSHITRTQLLHLSMNFLFL